MLEGMDIREAREDPTRKELLVFLDDGDARRRIGLLRSTRSDRLASHREGGQKDLRAHFYIRARKLDAAAQRHLDRTLLAALRILPGQADARIGLLDFRRDLQAVGDGR